MSDYLSRTRSLPTRGRDDPVQAPRPYTSASGTFPAATDLGEGDVMLLPAAVGECVYRPRGDVVLLEIALPESGTSRP